jgi:beta-lactam-binding protein with PASTA domain
MLVRLRSRLFLLFGLVAAASILVAANVAASRTSHEVTIPQRAAHEQLAEAFALLRSLCLRVSIDQAAAYSALKPAWVARVAPAVGKRVAVGSVVVLTPTDDGPIGSPAVLKSHPRYVVPNFVGRPAADAIAWASDHHMYWSIAALPALPSSHARQLFAAYTVTSQTPQAGESIEQGFMTGQSFHPTPLTLTVDP